MILQERKSTLIAYLKLKIEEQDWHGVADAAMDLRELEVQIRNERELEVKYKIHPEPSLYVNMGGVGSGPLK